ncbi:glycosyltransferase [Paucibacter sp. KCTC 42545]|uniref:glycosyltransferase n=1 Tax=Paucibacter sp. KCTC 42545 TaxID=1768242 RepID=UPI0018D201CA|nr:glycosyltransferase family 2 protein [Paucibacter sp. KCTC 42545]
MFLISICVCTFKRPAGLAKCLASLASMQLPGGCELEVVVVDNDSAASARPFVESLQTSYPLALRYFCEQQSGVGFARNRCLAESAGAWIAFIDDDEWADPQWLKELWSHLQASGVDGVFGPVLANFEVDPPAWLRQSGVYERHRDPSGKRLSWKNCASGNVIFRKKLVDGVGGFCADFAASGAEDAEFFWRCLQAGAVFEWCDSAIAQENIPPARMTRHYVLRRAYLGGHNYARLQAHQMGPSVYLNLFIRGSIVIVAFGFLALLARIAGNPRALFFETKVAGGWGKLKAAFSMPEREYGPGS